ncbi:MAG TPA: hypothetical protein VFA04_18255, partial [Bryobacteraceae bacterium]|nr:hypothetical protein [Bryobacteraceae bacterium]
RWAPLRPGPRKSIHELRGWGIFDRQNGEFSTGIDIGPKRGVPMRSINATMGSCSFSEATFFIVFCGYLIAVPHGDAQRRGVLPRRRVATKEAGPVFAACA